MKLTTSVLKIIYKFFENFPKHPLSHCLRGGQLLTSPIWKMEGESKSWYIRKIDEILRFRSRQMSADRCRSMQIESNSIKFTQKNNLSNFENPQNSGFWGAYPSFIWERSTTDPARKRVFRRWLLPLTMNKNLRFYHFFSRAANNTHLCLKGYIVRLTQRTTTARVWRFWYVLNLTFDLKTIKNYIKNRFWTLLFFKNPLNVRR